MRKNSYLKSQIVAFGHRSACEYATSLLCPILCDPNRGLPFDRSVPCLLLTSKRPAVTRSLNSICLMFEECTADRRPYLVLNRSSFSLSISHTFHYHWYCLLDHAYSRSNRTFSGSAIGRFNGRRDDFKRYRILYSRAWRENEDQNRDKV